MKIQNDNINFNSKIKLINQIEFNNKVKNLNPKKHYVGYPWNANTIKKGKKLFTTDIMDCIAGGIIDNNSITMFHLCTINQENARKHRLRGFDIKEIQRRILEKIDLAKENLHGFILGGFQTKENSKYNVAHLRKIKKIFEENQIPYSIFAARRDVHYYGHFSAYFDNKEDTLYITNSLSKPSKLSCFDKELEVFDDTLIYHTYKQEDFGYSRTKHIGTAEDFLKSQFREVYLSKQDEFI